MYLSVAFVAVIILVLASPAIWVAWWLLADLGEAMASRPADRRREVPIGRHQPAA
jgi:hypothetical protein